MPIDPELLEKNVRAFLTGREGFFEERHMRAQEEFLMNMDFWTVGKCFEKGFECFYQTVGFG